MHPVASTGTANSRAVSNQHTFPIESAEKNEWSFKDVIAKIGKSPKTEENGRKFRILLSTVNSKSGREFSALCAKALSPLDDNPGLSPQEQKAFIELLSTDMQARTVDMLEQAGISTTGYDMDKINLTKVATNTALCHWLENRGGDSATRGLLQPDIYLGLISDYSLNRLIHRTGNAPKQEWNASELEMLLSTTGSASGKEFSSLCSEIVRPGGIEGLSNKQRRALVTLLCAPLQQRDVPMLNEAGIPTDGADLAEVDMAYNVTNHTLYQWLYHGGGDAATRELFRPLTTDEKYFRAIDNINPIHMELLAFLRTSARDVNAQDERGLTPVSHAIRDCDCYLVDALIAKGVDINAPSGTYIDIVATNGLTALQIASHLMVKNGGAEGMRNTINHLIKRRGDVNGKSLEGMSCLHTVIQAVFLYSGYSRDAMGAERFEKNGNQVIKMLLDSGADRTVCDAGGRTPLEYAETHDLANAKTYLQHRFPPPSPSYKRYDECGRKVLRTEMKRNSQLEMEMRKYEESFSEKLILLEEKMKTEMRNIIDTLKTYPGTDR
jgi:hypothetical protein